MRPVVKKVFLDAAGNPIKKNFKHWGEAKPALVLNLGSYCSYCEVPSPARAGIDVEHVQYKDDPKYAALIYDWGNFLLGCKNCNPVKRTKDVVFADYHLPHLNNTMLSLRILEGGLVQVNPDLNGEALRRASNLLELVGLDRRPGHRCYSRKDDRWQNRMSAWNLAIRYLEKYREAAADMETLVDLALQNGFFTVWMTVFQGCPEVKRAFIRAFPGTAASCFDENGAPLNRNGTEI